MQRKHWRMDLQYSFRLPNITIILQCKKGTCIVAMYHVTLSNGCWRNVFLAFVCCKYYALFTLLCNALTSVFPVLYSNHKVINYTLKKIFRKEVTGFCGKWLGSSASLPTGYTPGFSAGLQIWQQDCLLTGQRLHGV